MERETRKIKRILNINNLTDNHRIANKTPIKKIENIIQKKSKSRLKCN